MRTVRDMGLLMLGVVLGGLLTRWVLTHSLRSPKKNMSKGRRFAHLEEHEGVQGSLDSSGVEVEPPGNRHSLELEAPSPPRQMFGKSFVVDLFRPCGCGFGSMRSHQQSATRRKCGERVGDEEPATPGAEQQNGLDELDENLPQPPRLRELLQRHAGAIGALCLLVTIAVSKTLLTKLVFKHVDTPVAYSVLSCVVTNVCMVPIFLLRQGSFKRLSKPMAKNFALVCVAIAMDLACTNVAISMLSVALQQCIRGTSPTATLLVERLINRKAQHPTLYVVVVLLCVGPVLTALGSAKWEASFFGIAMMIAAVFAGAFKYVLAHKMITTFKKELGTLSFLFWVEIFVAVLLTPWAILNGEAAMLLFGEQRPLSDWLLLYCTAAFGGVRVYSQFFFLQHTSATALSLSNLAVQALSIALSICFFGTDITAFLAVGVAVTMILSAVYTWLKVVRLPALRQRQLRPSLGHGEKRLDSQGGRLQLLKDDDNRTAAENLVSLAPASQSAQLD